MENVAPRAILSHSPGCYKWLLTADWQATPTNLDKLEKLGQQICALVVKHKVSHVIHLGDVKEAYNPVDVRVIQSIRDIFRSIAKLCKLVVVNGNHDRLSQVKDREHWGSLIADDANIYYIDKREDILLDNHKCCFMPWEQTPTGGEVEADYLFIHAEIKEAWLNASGRKSKDGVQAKARRGTYAGHIHGQQEIVEQTWVVGSPFPHTWAEANEAKGMLLVDPVAAKTKSIPSIFPGWFDPSLPGFPTKKKDWGGTRLRVTHPDGADRTLVQSKLEQEFPGATIHLVPETAEKLVAEAPKNYTDANLIKRFVKQSQYADKELLRATITTALEQTSRQYGVSTGFELLSIKCRNVLSFKRLSYTYKHGLTVIRGINHDLKDDSNGSGKTNFFQLPALLLYGRTRKGKGQTADRWRRRNSVGPCWIEGEVKLDDGRLLRIRRGRKPKGLQIWVDGKDVTSGKKEVLVQQRLEQWLGCNWDAFVTNMFVDKQQQSIILHGTPAQRQQLFSEVLNLGRFDLADEFLHKQLRRTQKANVEAKLLYEDAASTLLSLKQQSTVTGDLSVLQAELKSAEDTLEAIKTMAPQVPDNSKYLEAIKDSSKHGEKVRAQRQKIDDLREERSQLYNICPTCGRSVDKITRVSGKAVIAAKISVLETELKQLQRLKAKASAKLLASERSYRLAKRRHDAWSNQVIIATREVASLKTKVEMAVELKVKYTELLKKESQRVKYLRGYLSQIADQQECLNQARIACSRKGLPQELTRLLIPRLNKAITRYAALTDQHINARFTSQYGVVDVVIDNPMGGETLEDQSFGETDMISIMVSLGLREVTGRTPLLVCDEPGTGLSPIHSADFAGILLELPGRFAKVLVASHNRDLLEGLGSAPSITIQKQNGISTLEK